MSFTQREPLQPKLTALPASKDVDALVRAEHPDPFSILGPMMTSRAASLSVRSCRRP